MHLTKFCETQGVLRGQKARFQLFGDSVNTASRMESNGVRGKIHVSEATAKELIAHGKEDWLTLREDKITAKGKGEMTTYFVRPTIVKSSGRKSSVGSVYSDVTERRSRYIHERPSTAARTDMCGSLVFSERSGIPRPPSGGNLMKLA